MSDEKFMTEEDFALMDSSQTGDEWDANCDKIKAKYNGSYPQDWYFQMIISGRAKRIGARFGSSMEVGVTVVRGKAER